MIAANQTGTYLTHPDLRDVDMLGAKLRGAHLLGADLTGADLKGADLTGADLTGAILTGADLSGARLAGARAGGGAKLPRGITIPQVRVTGRSDRRLGYAPWSMISPPGCEAA